MADNVPHTGKAGRKFDSAFGFSFAIALGLVLFIAGLMISLMLGFGEGNSIGLIFGIPLLMLGLVLPLFMLRGGLKRNDVSGDCPYCGAPIKTSDATIRLNCPACNRVVAVKDEKLIAAE